MVRLRGTFAGVLLVVALVLARTAWAQVPDTPSEASAVPVGRAVLYPLFSCSAERTDNLFMLSDADPDNIQSADITSVDPGVIADLPFSHSSIRLGYAFSYRDYHTTTIEPNTTHYFLGDARLVFGSGYNLRVKADYQHGMLDMLALDPGGNLTFRGARYERNSVDAELAYEQGQQKRLAASLGEEIRGPLGENVSGLYHTDETHGSLTGEHRLGARTWALWEASAVLNLMSLPDFPPDYREDVRDVAGRLGVRFLVSPSMTVIANAGWMRSVFTGKIPALYRGVVGKAELQWTGGLGETVVAGYKREVYPTMTLDTAASVYCVSDQLHVEASTGSQRALSLGLSGYYFVNDFPREVPVRTDRISNAEAWAGYRYHGWLEWRVYVSWGSRSSTKPDFDYQVTRFGTNLRMGF